MECYLVAKASSTFTSGISSLRTGSNGKRSKLCTAPLERWLETTSPSLYREACVSLTKDWGLNNLSWFLWFDFVFNLVLSRFYSVFYLVFLFCFFLVLFWYIMDAIERRGVATFDLPGYFLVQTDIEEYLLLQVDGALTLLLVKLHWKRRRKNLWHQGKNPVIYLLGCTIYATVTAALL